MQYLAYDFLIAANMEAWLSYPPWDQKIQGSLPGGCGFAFANISNKNMLRFDKTSSNKVIKIGCFREQDIRSL